MDKSLDVSLASVVEVRAADISARERREWSWLLLGDEFAMVGSRASASLSWGLCVSTGRIEPSIEFGDLQCS